MEIVWYNVDMGVEWLDFSESKRRVLRGMSAICAASVADFEQRANRILLLYGNVWVNIFTGEAWEECPHNADWRIVRYATLQPKYLYGESLSILTKKAKE